MYLYSKPNCICCALNEGQIGVVGEVDTALYVLSPSTGPHLVFIIIVIIIIVIIIIVIVIIIIITLDVALYVLSASAGPHLVLSKLMEHCFSRNITTLTSDQGYYSSKVETSTYQVELFVDFTPISSHGRLVSSLVGAFNGSH